MLGVSTLLKCTSAMHIILFILVQVGLEPVTFESPSQVPMDWAIASLVTDNNVIKDILV